ncbi:unnamed protein product [Camellia sinensis]
MQILLKSRSIIFLDNQSVGSYVVWWDMQLSIIHCNPDTRQDMYGQRGQGLKHLDSFPSTMVLFGSMVEAHEMNNTFQFDLGLKRILVASY